jgi:hypothetical protein
MSVCAERKRLRGKLPNPAIEIVSHEGIETRQSLIIPHSAIYSQLRKRRNAGARKPGMHITHKKNVSVRITDAVFISSSSTPW